MDFTLDAKIIQDSIASSWVNLVSAALNPFERKCRRTVPVKRERELRVTDITMVSSALSPFWLLSRICEKRLATRDEIAGHSEYDERNLE